MKKTKNQLKIFQRQMNLSKNKRSKKEDRKSFEKTNKIIKRKIDKTREETIKYMSHFQ